MTPPRPTVSSLDALLQSTREQFDRTFADRLRQADAAGLRNRQSPIFDSRQEARQRRRPNRARQRRPTSMPS